MWRSFLAATDDAAAAAAGEEEVRSGPVAMGPDPACSARGSGRGCQGAPPAADRTALRLGFVVRARDWEFLNWEVWTGPEEEEEEIGRAHV